MNRIKVVADEIESENLNNNQVEYEFIPSKSVFEINEIKFTIKENTDIFFEGDLTNNRYEVSIDLINDITCNLYTIISGQNSKIRYKITLNDNSKLNWQKLNDTKFHKEMLIVLLNGIDSAFDYQFKSICTENDKYDLLVYHNKGKTKSNLENNIITVDNGSTQIQVSSFIPKGNNECVANQNNRIINLNDGQNTIKPNLYIDEYDVEANHSALIGKFNEDEMFYLNSRGLPKNIALQLLLKGFLLKNITNDLLINEIIKRIDQNWR